MYTTLDRPSTDHPGRASSDEFARGRTAIGLGGALGTAYDRGRPSRGQVAEDLQPRWRLVSDPGWLFQDPYGPLGTRQSRWGVAGPGDPSEANGTPLQGYPDRLWGRGEWRVTSSPKIVASFVGKVESLGEAVAIVTLVNEATGEQLESQCDTEVLREKGIGAGDEFRCEVVRGGGETATRLVRLSPRALSAERVAEIRASFEGRWDF